VKFLGVEFKTKKDIAYCICISSISFSLFGWFFYHFSQFLYRMITEAPWKSLGILIMPWVGIFIAMCFVWIIENKIFQNILKVIAFVLLAIFVSLWFGGITPR
jgi:hypothetical protein